MASLRELQYAFADSLRQVDANPASGLAVRPAENLAIYRNNSAWQFRNALALSFPVLHRRVGEEFFRQLAHHYHRAFPSRSGDLHWVGRDFADFLSTHLAGGDYAWLADLARLEWAREEAAVAEELPSLGVDALAGIAPDDLERLTFTLQPSLRLGASEFPVLSVWIANQTENAPPTDQSKGGEQFMVLLRDDSIVTQPIDPALHTFLSAMKSGAGLGDAMSAACFDESALVAALQFAFGQGLVVAITPRSGS